MQETRARLLGWQDPLEKEMATHSSTLASKIPWMEEPGGLQSMGSPRVGHDWATSLHFETGTLRGRKIHATYQIIKSYTRCIKSLSLELNFFFTLVSLPKCMQKIIWCCYCDLSALGSYWLCFLSQGTSTMSRSLSDSTFKIYTKFRKFLRQKGIMRPTISLYLHQEVKSMGNRLRQGSVQFFTF